MNALRLTFPPGLGAELDTRALEHDLGETWAQGMSTTRKGYVFESHVLDEVETLLALLDNIRHSAPRGQGGLSTAHAARVRARIVRKWIAAQRDQKDRNP